MPTLVLAPTSVPTAVPIVSTVDVSVLVSTPAVYSTAVPIVSVLPTPPAFAGVPGALAPLEGVELERANRGADAVPERPSLFDGRLLVGLYGAPSGRGLGILGRFPVTETAGLAIAQAVEYQELLTDTTVIPFFHMVTTIADPFPGADGNYSHRVLTTTVQQWIDVAHTFGLWAVVDIQVAHSSITRELAYVEPFVRQADVHLAVDPEFWMLPGAIPGARIGTMTGAQVNLVQAWLQKIASAVGERKMLIIHQFDNRMFVDKDVIEDYPLVELVWDADGFGGPAAKIADYVQYATEPGFEYGGFKLFYRYDVPVMTPEQVLQLEPFPAFVVYQ